MWPFKKKPDPWREWIENEISVAYKVLGRLDEDLVARSLTTHTHSLEEHTHELPVHEHPIEYYHTRTPAEVEDTPVLTGGILCPKCDAEYDLQADCHVGASTDVNIICSKCGCEFVVKPVAKQ